MGSVRVRVSVRVSVTIRDKTLNTLASHHIRRLAEEAVAGKWLGLALGLG